MHTLTKLFNSKKLYKIDYKFYNYYILFIKTISGWAKGYILK